MLMILVVFPFGKAHVPKATKSTFKKQTAANINAACVVLTAHLNPADLFSMSNPMS